MSNAGDDPDLSRDWLLTEWWLVAILTSVLVFALAAANFTSWFDYAVYDKALQLNKRGPDPRILLVTIDNQSLSKIGPWPWPRPYHAKIIDAIERAGPIAVGYDVLFTEPTNIYDDRQLARALKGRYPVFLPLLLNIPGLNGGAFDAIKPIAPVEFNAAGIGHASLTFDPDGITRHTYLRMGDGANGWPQLMVLVGGQSVSSFRSPITTAKDPKANRGPLIASDPALISYIGEPGSFPSVSAASLIRGEVPPAFLHGRIILVGASADGLGDRYPTPFGVMPGVEIQANLLDSMLSGHMIHPTPYWLWMLISLLPVWALLLSFRNAPARLIPLAFAVSISTVTLIVVGGFCAGFWIPPGPAIAAILLVYPLWSWRRLAAVSRYMHYELEKLASEPSLFIRPEKDVASDAIGRQIELLRHSILQARDMRRFISDRLHQMPDAVFIVSPSGIMILANEQADKLALNLGIKNIRIYNIDELLIHFGFIDSNGLNHTSLSLSDCNATNSNYDCHLTDGRFFSLRFAEQYSARNTVVGSIVRITDVTDKIILQRQRERMVQLLSHDIRSPQSSIIAILDLSPHSAVSDRIRAYALRTLDLSDGFINLARAEYLDYTMDFINLVDLLSDAADDLWPLYSSRNISVRIVSTKDEIIARAERHLLTRVIINLISNSIKYSEDGTEIICYLDEVNNPSNNSIILSIVDQGCGIPEEHLDKLFEPFHRVPGTSDTASGAGLGLAFSRTVITRHGGSIACESRLGVGTKMIIMLPLADETRSSNESPNPRKASDTPPA